MRITVGGLLMVSALGGAVYYGVTKSNLTTNLGSEIKSTKDKVGSLVKIYKGEDKAGSATATPTPTPLPVAPENNKAAPLSPDLAKNLPPDVVDQINKANAKKPAVKKKPKKPVKKVAKKKRVVKKKRKAKKPKTNSIDKMKGSYVALQLTSGRVVKGVLEGTTRREYKIQLPGLGVFSYDKTKVKKISLAE